MTTLALFSFLQTAIAAPTVVVDGEWTAQQQVVPLTGAADKPGPAGADTWRTREPILVLELKQKSSLMIRVDLNGAPATTKNPYDRMYLIADNGSYIPYDWNIYSGMYEDREATDKTDSYDLAILPAGTYSLYPGSFGGKPNGSSLNAAIHIVDITPTLNGTVAPLLGRTLTADRDTPVHESVSPKTSIDISAFDLRMLDKTTVARQPLISVDIQEPGEYALRLSAKGPAADDFSGVNKSYLYLRDKTFHDWKLHSGVYSPSEFDWWVSELEVGRYEWFVGASSDKVLDGKTTFSLDLVPVKPTLVSLDPQLSKNYTVLSELVVGSEKTPESACPNDYLRANQPSAVLNIDQGLAPLQIRSASGRHTKVFARHSSGETWCTTEDQTFLDLPELSPGTLELYPMVRPDDRILNPHANGSAFVDLELEQMDRPREVAWSGVRRLDVDGSSQQLRLSDSAKDQALLIVPKPMTYLRFRAAAGSEREFTLVGPYDEFNRPTPDFNELPLQNISAMGGAKVNRLEPGIYRLQSDGRPLQGVISVQSEDAPFDHTVVADAPPPKSISDRALSHHFPLAFGSAKDPFANSEFFLHAPTDVFVYAKNEIPEVYGLNSPILPGEPLGVIWSMERDSQVVTADGASVQVPTKYLTATAPSAVALPSEVRGLTLDWESAVRYALPADQAAIKSFEAKRKAFDTCYSKVWESHGGDSSNLYDYDLVTYVNGSVSSVENYGDKVDQQGWSSCGGSGVDTTQQALFKKLDEHIRAALVKRMGEIRQRFTAE